MNNKIMNDKTDKESIEGVISKIGGIITAHNTISILTTLVVFFGYTIPKASTEQSYNIYYIFTDYGFQAFAETFTTIFFFMFIVTLTQIILTIFGYIFFD